MIPKIVFLLFLAFSLGCGSIEFIPDQSFTAYNSRFSLKSWEEVEIRRDRPSRAFLLVGEMVIKSHEGGTLEEERLKKELFSRKMDGIWITQKSKETLNGLGFETMDSRGHTTHTYDFKEHIPVWRGYCYRYK